MHNASLHKVNDHAVLSAFIETNHLLVPKYSTIFTRLCKTASDDWWHLVCIFFFFLVDRLKLIVLLCCS